MSATSPLTACPCPHPDRPNPSTEEDIARIRTLFRLDERVRPVAQGPGYFVSERGRLFSSLRCTRRPAEEYREMKLSVYPGQYVRVRLRVDRASETRLMHRLVAHAFLGERAEPQTQVRHLDGNKHHNAAGNLAWGTPAENARDAVNHGRIRRGENHPGSKLTWAKVGHIWARRAAGWTQRAIAQELRVSCRAVQKVLAGETWRGSGGPLTSGAVAVATTGRARRGRRPVKPRVAGHGDEPPVASA